jgi:hypothetical protein
LKSLERSRPSSRIISMHFFTSQTVRTIGSIT